jgi:hypothetical protein
MRRRALVAFALLATAPAFAAGPDFSATAFDKPLARKTVDIGPAETVPPSEKQVRCAYFPTFMVKEIDEQEVGAAQLSLLPATAPCQHANLPAERVVDIDTWSGYFAGAHGEFVVFSAGDGIEGGMGFAIVRPPDANILYSAVAKTRLHFAAAAGGTTLVRFEAIHPGDCSVIANGAACAAAIGKAAGTAPPDIALCKRGYAATKGASRQSLASDPSVISYNVTVTLDATRATARIEGAPTACWPSE